MAVLIERKFVPPSKKIDQYTAWKTRPKALGVDHDFENDPDYPAVLRVRPPDGIPYHIVLISNVLNVHFVWHVEGKCFAVVNIDPVLVKG